jgi:hypothetical protein
MIIVVTALLYGCGKVTLLKYRESRIETLEVIFLRPVVGYALYGHKTNEVREELNTYNSNEITFECRCK